MSKRILIGKIVAAHGIKGFVKILPLCDDLDLLTGRLFTSEDGPETLDVKIKSSAGKSLLAEIQGVHDRNTAETIKCSLFVSRETLSNDLADGEFYIEDLIGLTVIDETGTAIGTVRAIDNFGASDLIEILPPSGKTFYVPYTDDYVIDVDIDGHSLSVTNIEDFRDE